MDDIARRYFDGDRFLALKSVLAFRLQVRSEVATEAAIAAEALAADGRALVVHGVLYPSVAVASRAYEVNDDSVHRRMHEGQTAEQAIEDLRKHALGILVHGKRYLSLTAVAKAYNVNLSNLSPRVRSGETPEQAIEALCKRAKSVFVHEKYYPSVSAAARAYGIRPNKVSFRVRKGESVEQAIDALIEGAAKRTRNAAKRAEVAAKHAVVVHGVLYASCNAAARAHNVHYVGVHFRIRNRGETAEQAIDAVIEHISRRAVVVHDTRYVSVKSASIAHHVNNSSVHRRMHEFGETAEQAIDALLTSPPRRTTVHKEFVFNGRVYLNVAQAARANGLNADSIYERARRNNETAQQAMQAILANRRRRGWGEEFVVYEKTHRNLAEAAESNGISKDSLYYHMRKNGGTPEQGVSAILARRNKLAAAAKQVPLTVEREDAAP